MGDIVNTAARLEGANKAFSTDILFSKTTRDSIDQKILCRKIDDIRVVGRQDVITVFEAMEFADIATLYQTELSATYELALDAWSAKNFTKVKTLLEAVHTTDSASRKLFDRASELEKNPPGPDWVPVNELREK
jgi:adenylate cyclase